MALRAARNVIRSAWTVALDPPAPTARVVDTCETAPTASVHALIQDTHQIMLLASRVIGTASTAAQDQITQSAMAPVILVRKLSSALKLLLKVA